MTVDRLYRLSVLCARPQMDAATLAEQTRYMASTSAMFSYIQTPYLRTPTAALSDIAGTCGVVVKSPAQIGKSTMIENFLAWIVEYDRANTMVILDTKNSAEKMSRGRIRPFLRTRGIDNPKNSPTKDPDKSNSVVNIGLGAGANLFLCSAKSPSDLRSTPSKFCAFDEVDAWPDELPGEGDPLQNAIQRMMRFRGMYLITSTPTSFDGRINQNFLIGTQETWGCECECGAFMDVRYNDIDFAGDTPIYHCKSCGLAYSEKDIKLLKHLYSNPKNEKPFEDKYHRKLRSFEIFGTLCHEFYTWEYLKNIEMQSLSLGEASYQSFVNTRLAEVYKTKDEIYVEAPELMRHAMCGYSLDCIPPDIAFIVCGVDTHDSCLYVETVGFSEDCKYMYGLGYNVLVGDPNEAEVWRAFDDVFNKIYTRADGELMQPKFAFCDSGGHRTNAIYIQSYRNKRLMPIKGFVSNKQNAVDPLIGKQQKLCMNGGIKGRCTVQFIGVNAGKDEILFAIQSTIAGDQRMCYTKNCGYDADYFSGLLSERRINGKWIAPKKGHTNNEPLDCRVYALACARYYRDKYFITGLDRERIGDNMAKKKDEKKTENERIVKDVKKANEQSTDATKELQSNITPKNKHFPHM